MAGGAQFPEPAGTADGAPNRFEKLLRGHMGLIDTIVRRLKSVPEGNGTMFDNTMIMYFPENGETHHGIGTESPFLILAGDNCNLTLKHAHGRR